MPRGLLKIIHITGSLDNLTETFIQSFVKEVDKLDYIDLKVYTLERMKMKSNLRNPVNFIETSRYSKLKMKIRSFFNLKTTLRNRLFEYGISDGVYNSTQIIFVDFSVNFINIFNRVDKFEKPVFVFLHGYDASKVFRNKDFTSKFKKLGGMNNVTFVSPCNFFLNKLKVSFGFSSDKLLKLPYGSEIREITNDMSVSEGGVYTLLFVGRFVEKKNPLGLIEMLDYLIKIKNLDNIQLVLIGDGPLMNEVVERIEHYNLEKHVKLKGAMPHGLVLKEFKKAKIYVQNSVTDFQGDQEGLPNSILEAVRFGLPVVSTYHSGISEIIIDGFNGYLAQEFDFVALGERIYSLITDEILYNRMTENVIKSGKKDLWTNCDRVDYLMKYIK